MADEYSNNDIDIQTPEAGIEPERPRIRKLNQAEIEQWSKAIHQVCEGPTQNKRGWVPQLRAAYAHLMPFVDEQCPTAYTDCRYRIGINPDFLDPKKTTIEQLAFVLLHETMHNTQHHRDRLLEKKGINGKLANFATDLEINGIIAQGVFGIDLSRPESPANGNWDYLMGEFKQLNDEQANNINSKTDEHGNPLLGRTYKGGDWFYQGGLFPRHGQFSEFPTDWTAEQYLALLEVETEDMTMKEFQERQQQQQQQNGQGSQNSGAQGGIANSGQDGQGEEDGAPTGAGGNGANAGSGAGGGMPGASGASGGSGNSNGGAGGGSGSGNSYDNDVHLPGEQQNQADGSGSGSGQGAGNGTGGGSGMSDGYGGEAEESSDGHVKVTHIYKKNPDGTRTEVGKDALVDDIGKSYDDEVWKEASKLGIDPITRGEEQKVKEQIAHDIEVFRRSNSYGYGSGDMLLNYIERGLRPPTVNWKKALRHAVTRACQEQMKGRDDYTYRRINRRYSQGKFIFPGMTSYVPTIRFALDTSGSMSADEYYNALSEADAILRLANAKIQFCCWDGACGEVKQVKGIKEIKGSLCGGGGTCPVCLSDAIGEEKQKDRPDVLVVATDGCFDWQPFAESLREPHMQKLTPIVIVVFPFTEDRYYAKQGELRQYQELLRKYHRKAMVMQAWAKK